MDSEKSFKILNILYDLCTDETYKIIDYTDISTALKDAELNNSKIKDLINLLDEQGCISVKCLDEEICLKLEPKGRRLVEDYRYQEKLKAQAEQERLDKERREREEAEHKAKLEEERKKAALDIEKLIEETKLNMKKMSRSEKQEAEKTIEELSSKPEYQEEIVKKSEEIIPIKEEIKPVKVEEIVNAPANIVYNTSIDNKIIRKIARFAFYGGIFGGLIGSLAFWILKLFFEVG